jgi:multiple antibiotic resistance protein
MFDISSIIDLNRYHGKDVLSATFTLFAVMDVLGCIPSIISIKNRLKPEAYHPFSITCFSGSLIFLFFFGGISFLEVFGVDIHSFAVAGSFVMAILAMEMILGIQMFKSVDENSKLGSLIPIGFPLLVGAGTLTTVVSMKTIYSQAVIFTAVSINLLIMYFSLKAVDWIEQKICVNGLEALKKFFGIILLALAIRIFKSNFVTI